MRSIQILVAFTLLLPAAHAVTLIGNMPQTNDDAVSANLTGLRRKALGFTTDNQAYELHFMEARLFNSTSTVTPEVHLYSSVAGGPAGQMPGALISVLPGQLTVQAGFTTVAFFSLGGVFLSPNTIYWVVMGTAQSEPYDWRGSSPAITPTGLATHFGSLFTADGGASWSSSGVLNSYFIEVTPVPEPLGVAVFGAGICFACLRARRR